MEEKSDLLCVALRAGKESMHKSLVRRLLINIRILWAAEYWGYKDKPYILCSQGTQSGVGKMNV